MSSTENVDLEGAPHVVVRTNGLQGSELQNGNSKRQNEATSIEDAVRLTEYGGFHRWLLFVSAFGVMGEMLESVNVGYLISAAQCDFNMSNKDKGLLGSITNIGSLCSTHFWGVIADTWGRKKVMQLTVICTGVCTILSGLSPNFWSLVLLRFINGFFLSAPISMTYAYVGEFNTPERRNRNVFWISFCCSVPYIILPVLAWAILPQPWDLTWALGPFRTWRFLTIFTAIPGLLSGFCFLTLPESPKFLLTAGRSEEALRILTDVYTRNTGKSADTYPVKALKEEPPAYSVDNKTAFSVMLKVIWNQTAPLFKPPFLLLTLVVFVLQYGNLASASGLPIWLPELFNLQARYSEAHPGEGATFCYAAQHQNTTRSASNATATAPLVPVCNTEIKTEVFINTLIIGVVTTLAPVVGGLVVNKLGKKNLLIICMFLTGVSSIALDFSSSYIATLILASIVVSVAGMCISLVAGIAVELFPTNIRGMALSLSYAFGRIGSMTGNLIFGFLITTKCEVAFIFFGGLLLLNGVLGFLLPKRGRYAS